jgi:hypothetical protein
MAKESARHDRIRCVLLNAVARNAKRRAIDGPPLSDSGGAGCTPQWPGPDRLRIARGFVSERSVDVLGIVKRFDVLEYAQSRRRGW